jgi:two-component system nitrogen regulation response regulator NtrX
MSSKDKVDVADLPVMEAGVDQVTTGFKFPTFKQATDAYQREFILHKLNEYGGSVARAAEEMGVDRSHLYRRMRSLGIQAK